ncbi:MAG TPA: hypothetical protein VN493_05030 [Thermoanaerobaculia bacterium]|nr:hypothetical protein [Thermoanaerobaculia bacterium]
MDQPRNSPLESAVIEVLKIRLSYLRLSLRKVERDLQMGHGGIAAILRGQRVLRIQHLEVLGPILGFTPDQILREALDRMEGTPVSTPDDILANRVASCVVDKLLPHLTLLEPPPFDASEEDC